MLLSFQVSTTQNGYPAEMFGIRIRIYLSMVSLPTVPRPVWAKWYRFTRYVWQAVGGERKGEEE